MSLKKLNSLKRVGKIRKLLTITLLLGVVVGVSGCHTFGFYGQAIKGQYQIFTSAQPIDKVMTNPQTPQDLKVRFELLSDLRSFAAKHLELPVDNHYRKYADLGRPYVVWNVEAAPEFSMEPKTWWYPIVGSLEYRGYFSRAGATNYAGHLHRQGFDVSVGGVQAYSTLGWFRDPVLNTFIYEPEAELAELVFHELGHQRAFARGDTDFNEAFATTVGQEGARRWLKAKGDTAGLQAYETHLQRTAQFVNLVMKTRARLESLYGDERNGDGKVIANRKACPIPSDQLRESKRRIFQEMREEYTRLKGLWNGSDEFDGWFKKDLNNAHLNAVAAYYEMVPGFEQLLARNGGDLEKFYQAVERLSKQPKKERHNLLQIWAKDARPPAEPQKELAQRDPVPSGKPSATEAN